MVAWPFAGRSTGCAVGTQAFGGPAILDFLTFGTFTRPSSATYLTGAPTDGTSSFIATASSGVRRFEDRGDGSGAMFLYEGSSANRIPYSENFADVSWTLSSGTPTTGKPSPDGGTGATRMQINSGGFLGETTSDALSTAVSGSVWVRTPSGTSGPNTNQYRATDGRIGTTATATTTYSHFELTGALSVGQGTVFLPTDGRLVSGGLAAGARDVYIWGAQRENKFWCTSYIQTTGVATTRNADILTATAAQTPATMFTSATSVYIAPYFSSTQFIAANATQVLFSFAEDTNGDEALSLVVTGGTCKVRATSGGVTKCESNAITYSAHQLLMVSYNPAAGTISVSGATTGNGTVTGTAWAFASTNPATYVGMVKGATLHYYGRFGRFVYGA